MLCEKISGREFADMLPAYKAFKASRVDITILQDLEWLLHTRKDELDHVGAFFLRNGIEVGGFAPFLVQSRPLRCFLGELKLAELPLRCLMLLGAPHFPDDEQAYASLFEEVNKLSSDIDGIFIFGLPVDSFLWGYLQKTRVISQRYIRYLPQKPDMHQLIVMPRTYEEYAQKWSGKTRNTLKRRLSTLEKDMNGQLQLCRVTSPDEVDGYLSDAVTVSKKSYQWHLLGLGLRDSERWRRNLKFLAERGWLRSYLLRCRGVPTAFTVCYQDEHQFYSVNFGYSQEWSDYSVGTILHMLMIKDLFAHNRPSVVDLGRGSGEHKKLFANRAYPDCDLYLLRRCLRSVLARNIHKASRFMSGATSSMLDLLHLKRAARRIFRKSSV